MPGLLKNFIRFSNPTGAEPVPQSALMNDTQNLSVMVEPGKTYLFRIINMAAFAAQHVWFEEHTMRIVEVDGIYTEPAEADMIYITAAQRYSVLITMKDDASANYAFVGSMDEVSAPRLIGRRSTHTPRVGPLRYGTGRTESERDGLARVRHGHGATRPDPGGRVERL